jgi:5-methylthioadenosine/S-adenosylhomocysteine deaminase
MTLRPSVRGSILLLLAFAASSALPGALAAEPADLLVSGGTVVTLDPARRVLEDGAVAIRGERIVAVGPARELRARYRARRLVDARGGIVLPGLVNTHTHAPMVLFRGIADDLALMEWLEKFIFPAEARNVTAEFVRWGTALACLEMIRSGTTTFCDMYYFEDVVAEVAAEAGMRGVLGETIIDFPTPDSKTPTDALAYTEKFIARWKGSPLVVPAVAPHASFTNRAESLVAARALADRHGVPFVIHLSETRDEERQMQQKYGMSSTAWLEKLGVLAPRVVANHCVHLSPEDMAILRRRGVGVTHNPESNMKLASGLAPVPRLLELGIAVGLGTDGAASNNDLDMFEAMDFAAKLHKHGSGNPTMLAAERVIELATLGGARVLGLADQIGSLEPGKRADLIVVDTRAPRAVPLYNVYSHLVYALKGSDVRTSIINGKVVMIDGRVITLREAEILPKARELAARVRATLTK